MTEANTTHVVYKALADFSDLRKRINSARRSLRNLQKAETEYNKNSVAGAKTVEASNKKATASVEEQVEAFEENASAAGKSARAIMQQAAAAREATKIGMNLNRETGELTENTERLGTEIHNTDRRIRSADGAGKRFGATLANMIRQMNNGRNSTETLGKGVEQLHRGFVRLGNWRPRLIPPFIALVPVIAAVAGALNPLVALFGAAGAAAIGFGNSLASLTGVALALPGILGAIVAGVSSVIAAFGGMGNVFRAYGQLTKANSAAAGSGSSGPSPEDRAMALEDAEERLSDAQRRAARAQVNLNKARQQALKDLINLRIEVSRAGLNEERALANLQLAREEYNNVLADPGSTKGDKLDAAAALKEAEADLLDVRRENLQNSKDLAEAEKKGVEGSDQVVDAKEDLSDALREVRKAQIDLRKEQTGETAAMGAAATAANAYQEALDKLSPSARAFALGLIAMKDEWDAMRQTVQESFFSEIVDNLDELKSLIPVIGNLWSKAAGAMGRVVSKGIEMVASGPWSKDFAASAESNATIIENLGDAFLFVLDAMRHLVIAAAPFTEWLTESLAIGAKNFRDMVQAGRESGDLASWLNKVAGRLEKWWTIVKNIGATIFNYGAAASEFGDWITDGMVNMTESWKAASEEARKEGSPFRTWLEDTKPVLTELKGLFGDFFSWFARESANPENLKDAQDLLKLIRDDLGPAISNFLDTLAKTDIDEKLVEALSSIIDSISEIIDKGGNAAFESFFDVVTGFFDAVANVVKALPPGALEPLLKLIGAIAGLALISKFPGVSLLFSGLTKLVTNEKVMTKVLDKLTALGKSSFKGMIDGFNAMIKAGKTKLPTGGAVPGVGPGAVVGKAGSVAKLAGIAAAVGVIVAGAVQMAENLAPVVENLPENWGKVTSGDPKQFQEGANGIGSDLMKANPFGLGATAGIVDDIFGTDLTGIWGGLVDGFQTGFIEPVQTAIFDFFSDLPSNIGKLGANIWTGVQSIGTWLGEQWQNFLIWLEALPYNIGLAAGTIWNNIKSFVVWLGEKWDETVLWWEELPQKIADTAGDIWNKIQNIGTWLTTVVWPAFTKWLGERPEAIKKSAGNLWNKIVTVKDWLVTTVWPAFTKWLSERPEAIRKAAGNIWKSLGGIGTYLSDQWTKLVSWLGTLPGKIAKKVGNLWDWLFGGVAKGWSDSAPTGDAPGGAAMKGIRGPSGMAGGPAAAKVSAALKQFPGLRITETLGNRAYDMANGVARSPNSYHYDKNNPAVDIGGNTPDLHKLWRVLVSMGGWRQMLWQVPGHYDHIHVANTGGRVPGHGNGDTVPFRLTPGEFVLRKAVVNRIGPENVARLNSGVLSYSQLLERAYANQGARKPKQGGGSGFGFDGQGLMSGAPGFNPLSSLSNSAPVELMAGGSSSTIDQRIIVENMNVNNPKQETASDSLPRSIRKLAYATSGLQSGR